MEAASPALRSIGGSVRNLEPSRRWWRRRRPPPHRRTRFETPAAVTSPAQRLEDFQHTVLGDLLTRSLLLAAFTVVAALLAWWIGRRSLQRLGQGTATARRISAAPLTLARGEIEDLTPHPVDLAERGRERPRPVLRRGCSRRCAGGQYWVVTVTPLNAVLP
ncbi:hypothetical protein GCM10010519_28670 [Streptomyces lactacystinicus]|uniref:hypothetical protein n=1 Tax=unclassified Kitasatospora TaxID=2633591 RepID=UPI00338B4275